VALRKRGSAIMLAGHSADAITWLSDSPTGGRRPRPSVRPRFWKSAHTWRPIPSKRFRPGALRRQPPRRSLILTGSSASSATWLDRKVFPRLNGKPCDTARPGAHYLQSERAFRSFRLSWEDGR
jgi:hypothetical protein